jgi:hypothetical protein
VPSPFGRPSAEPSGRWRETPVQAAGMFAVSVNSLRPARSAPSPGFDATREGGVAPTKLTKAVFGMFEPFTEALTVAVPFDEDRSVAV